MTKPRAILFTDWDGTVTLQDSNDMLTDKLGMGRESRLKINDKLIDNTVTFRDGFNQMLTSVSDNGHNLQDCIRLLLANVDLDPGFRETFEYCRDQNIPVIIVSSGMKPIIKELIRKLIGEDAEKYCEIYANDVEELGDGGKWRIKYRDDTSFGHDKHQSIVHAVGKIYKNNEKGTLFYCGDGVSDVSAAESCDLLFAKRGKDLVDICKRDGVAFKEFDSFSDILNGIRDSLQTYIQT